MTEAEFWEKLEGTVRRVVREELAKTSLGDTVPAPSYVSDADRKKNPTWYGSQIWRATLEKVDDALIVVRRVEAELKKLQK